MICCQFILPKTSMCQNCLSCGPKYVNAGCTAKMLLVSCRGSMLYCISNSNYCSVASVIWASPGFWSELLDKIFNDVGGRLIFILWANYFDCSSRLMWVWCSSCAQHDIWEWQLDMTFWHLWMTIQNATISRQKAKEHGGWNSPFQIKQIHGLSWAIVHNIQQRRQLQGRAKDCHEIWHGREVY